MPKTYATWLIGAKNANNNTNNNKNAYKKHKISLNAPLNGKSNLCPEHSRHINFFRPLWYLSLIIFAIFPRIDYLFFHEHRRFVNSLPFFMLILSHVFVIFFVLLKWYLWTLLFFLVRLGCFSCVFHTFRILIFIIFLIIALFFCFIIRINYIFYEIDETLFACLLYVLLWWNLMIFFQYRP